MAKIKNYKETKFIKLLVVMLVLTAGLIYSLKMVQKNQENRSSAAYVIQDGVGGPLGCIVASNKVGVSDLSLKLGTGACLLGNYFFCGTSGHQTGYTVTAYQNFCYQNGLKRCDAANKLITVGSCPSGCSNFQTKCNVAPTAMPNRR